MIVNSSPWGGSLGVTALRLVRAMLAAGLELAAVYFREEGVYHALPARVSDDGTPPLADAWLELHQARGLPLLLCSSAGQRRLAACPDGGFREAGRAEVLDLMRGCDRVVAL